MSRLRLFTDEDVYGAIAPALRKAGFDAVSTPEAVRLGEPDDTQLAWAADQGRALVSFNVAHFAKLPAEWMRRGVNHAGIIVSSQRSIGDLLRRLLHLCAILDAETMRNRIEFLTDW